MTESETIRRARDLLESQTTMVLSTVGEDGLPSGAPLFYWSDADLNLYWLSSRSSRHSRHLAGRPDAAVTVYESVTDWRAIKGVQMTGSCAEWDGRFLADYRRKFGLGPEFDTAIAASTPYIFRPRWLRYLDNSAGFGFKIEIDLVTFERR